MLLQEIKNDLIRCLKSLPDEGYFPERVIRYVRFHYYQWIDTSAGGLLVRGGIIRPVISVSTLTWFISYIFIVSSAQ
jgi:hypothetical protein